MTDERVLSFAETIKRRFGLHPACTPEFDAARVIRRKIVHRTKQAVVIGGVAMLYVATWHIIYDKRTRCVMETKVEGHLEHHLGWGDIEKIAVSTVVFLTTTGANTWTVDATFNSSDNTLEAVGGGGNGASAGGAGGNGGTWAKSTNVALSGTASYNISAGNTGDTWISNTGSAPGSSSAGVLAKPAQTTTTGCIGVSSNAGGTGGAGDGVTTGGGAGGAAGPGGKGGNGAAQATSIPGGGGGGAGTTNPGGNGGNPTAGSGGATGGGNGGAGNSSGAGTGGSNGGACWTSNPGGVNKGPGGGGGGGRGGAGGPGGLYGGAGGGGSGGTSSGAQGLLILTWNPAYGAKFISRIIVD